MAGFSLIDSVLVPAEPECLLSGVSLWAGSGHPLPVACGFLEDYRFISSSGLPGDHTQETIFAARAKLCPWSTDHFSCLYRYTICVSGP